MGGSQLVGKGGRGEGVRNRGGGFEVLITCYSLTQTRDVLLARDEVLIYV